MPTIHRFGSVSIKMYADDHNPPHFHIVSTDFQVLVRISDLSIIEGDGKPSDLAEALVWARLNQLSLALKWAELNERD